MPKFLSTGFLGLAALCFLLPWVNVSCQGQSIAKLSGVQLVTGTTIAKPSMPDMDPMAGLFGQAAKPAPKPEKEEKEKVNSEILAVAALALIAVGLVVSIARKTSSCKITGSIAAVAAVALIALQVKMSKDIAKAAEGMLQIQMMIGYYSAVVFTVITAIIGFVGNKLKIAKVTDE